MRGLGVLAKKCGLLVVCNRCLSVFESMTGSHEAYVA